MPLNKEEDRTL